MIKDDRTREVMNALADGLDDTLNNPNSPVYSGTKLGFALLVFTADSDGAQSNYISNADRSQVINAMRETANRLEQRQSSPKGN